MTIELVSIGYEQKSALGELLNLYLYELSDLVGANPNEHGRFEYGYLDHYWTEPDGMRPSSGATRIWLASSW